MTENPELQPLLESVLEYNPKANTELIKKAFLFAEEAHKEQKRDSGEPYIIHPIEVAKILIDLKSDSATLAAALLHDVLEDTKVNEEKLEQEFGKEVTELVKGVTKVNIINFESKEDYNAENIRKVILAMSKDVRTVLIKLADRLHNMRTLRYKSNEAQKVIAKETLDIYAPIAYKLGIFKIKSELEDLSMKYLMPETYADLKNKVTSKKEEREKQVKVVIDDIEKLLKEKNIPARIFGRAKHFYSIYKKISRKNKQFNEIYDIIAIRIVTTSVDNCYSVLDLIHSNFKPIPSEFEDYIASPKSNMYQSLHTVIIGPNKQPIEVQIRTMDMHHIAEDGVAAHWRYKGTEHDKRFDKKITMLKQVLAWKREAESAQDFIESLKVDLFEDEIIVLTPKGEPIDLPEGSCPVDFAYRVHTEVGNSCSQAKVNGKIVPLDYKLNAGDIVEIVTSHNTKPSRNWLRFVKTNFAKTEIRQAHHIKGIWRYEEPERAENLAKYIITKEKKPLKLSECCSPQKGDKIIAFLTKDNKITVHKEACPNAKALGEAKKVDVKWKIAEQKSAEILMAVKDQVGLLAQVLNKFAEAGYNIESVNSKVKKDHLNLILKIRYDDKDKLEETLAQVRIIDGVIDVHSL